MAAEKAADGPKRFLINACAKGGMGIRATHWLTGIVAQICLRPLIRYESTTLNVMDEAQGFDILLKSTGNVMGVSPEAWSSKFVGDASQHGMSFGQLPFRFIGGAKRKNAVVVGRLVQNSLKEEDDFLRGRRHVSVYLLEPAGKKKTCMST